MGIAARVVTPTAAETADQVAVVETYDRCEGRVFAVNITAFEYFDMGHARGSLF
jgi:hypothetical protein